MGAYKFFQLSLMTTSPQKVVQSVLMWSHQEAHTRGYQWRLDDWENNAYLVNYVFVRDIEGLVIE
jgi:hypothetical protein